MTEQTEILKKKLLITTDTYYPKRDGVLIFLEKIACTLLMFFFLKGTVPSVFADSVNKIATEGLLLSIILGLV